MIQSELKDNVVRIKISSGKGNFLDISDIDSLLGIVNESAMDDQTLGMIISGESHCFCTGLKISELNKNEFDDFFFKFDSLLLRLFGYPKPLVIGIEGHSIGGGLLLQACADYVIASKNIKIKVGLPELKLGLTVDELMVNLLQFNVGNVRIIQDLLYRGDFIGVEQTKLIGLIDKIAEPQDVLTEVQKEIVHLMQYDSISFKTTKLQLRAHTLQLMRSAMDKRCYEIFKKTK